jgi:hypothetical protein
MTRDQWIKTCAQRFIDRGGLDIGEAAAYAEECARQQKDEHGIDPAAWDAPAVAADDDMSYWDNDGAEDDEP